MTSKIEEEKLLKQTELIDSQPRNKLFDVSLEHSESEMKWVQLHQMFDR